VSLAHRAGALAGRAALQNLPSVVAAHVLDAQPGMRVLDMCAAPGGKACAIAESMRNEGEIIALDRTHGKVQLIEEMAASLGHTVIQAVKKDSTALQVSRRHKPTVVRPFLLYRRTCCGLHACGSPSHSSVCVVALFDPSLHLQNRRSFERARCM
jgi:16S rRNA C967 or C1407 C5-methylase (RsmB/RsmF family)